MPELFTLFPTPVYKVGLSNHQEFKKKCVPKLTELFKQEPDKKAKWATMCHTWQAGFNDITPNYFECIQKEIDVAIEQYFGFLRLPPFQYEKTGWFNVHDSEMYQEVHNHIPAILSGIYYIQFDKTKDSQVVFRNPSETFLALMAGSKVPINNPMLLQHTLFDDSFIIEEGDLILFPASLNHLVPKAKQTHDQLRITLSFNVTPITSVNAVKEWEK
tara:strand:+ start:103 stop:750 length:648 start_codon:yes stop_codon:yes gene_type:complete